MSTDVVDGVEYFNTVVVQPHRKLVTNQGRGYHVRCRYQTQEKFLQNDFNVRYDLFYIFNISADKSFQVEEVIRSNELFLL